MALIKCPNCGKEFSEYAEKCPQCGLSKNEVQLRNQENKVQKQKERKRIITRVICGILVVLFGVGLLYFLLPEDTSKYSFSDGLAKIESRGKIGFIDKKGKRVVPCKYDDALDFSDGLACVRSGSKWGYIDKKGTEVIPFIYYGASSFHEGLAAVRKASKWGYIDKTGAEVIPSIFDKAEGFFNGQAKVKKDGRNKYVSIDKTGKEVNDYSE